MDDQRIQRMERRDGALLRNVGDVIAAEPERYDQSDWAVKDECGTVCCLAGHAVSLLTNFQGFRFFDDGIFSTHQAYVGGEVQRIESLAAESLGLTSFEKGLFASDWVPAGDPATPLHERVRAALYALADGATVEEVSA